MPNNQEPDLPYLVGDITYNSKWDSSSAVGGFNYVVISDKAQKGTAFSITPQPS